jgi:hypothetical protein
MNVEQLDKLFHEYGYEAKERHDSYRVYVLNQGMYHGAEILVLDDINVDQIVSQYSKLGYHAKLQRFNSVEQAEYYLFNGFFNTQTTKFDIEKRYSEYAANQVKHYCDPNIKYQYISMPYSVYGEESNNHDTMDIISAIKREIGKKGARLIIVEAAAGFGKTCTAYEIYKSFIDTTDYHKPIFTELSNNRDAKQFKYILWSEIDKEKDTTAKQDLVVYNIKNGRIPLIIDGFDELLSKDIDPGKAEQLNEFEQVETMLSTIGDLLTNESKVILTSRKTAIFAGAEFETWVDSYKGNFDVVRFQLDKPDIKEWLSFERYDDICKGGIPIECISNPVLLTYLRNVSSDDFEELMLYPETITDNFFKFLLNREKERQNLNIRWEDQMHIFENLAKALVEFDITGESRLFIKELIKEYNKKDLMYYKESMTTKQTLDELADTLTNHALLDRVGNKDFITFINEFVFGYLLGKCIINDTSNFLQKLKPLPDYLLELAVASFKYSSNEGKQALWNRLSDVKERMPLTLAIATDCVLKGRIFNTYQCEGVNSYTFEGVLFSGIDCRFVDVSFVDTTFTKCIFDAEAFTNVTFTGCRFIDCKVNNTETLKEGHSIHCYGCDDYYTGVIATLENKKNVSNDDIEDVGLELQILGKYFKVDGKTPKMRYVSSIRKEFEKNDLDIVFATFYLLKKKGLLLVDGNNSHISKTGINYFHKNIQL